MTRPTTTGIWAYRETTWTSGDLTGYKVEARDGDIGKVDKANNQVGSARIVVDTGPWIFSKKVMIPAGVVRDVDHDSETIFVDRMKDEIKNAPEFDDDMYEDQAYRDRLGTYYDAR